MKICEFTEHDLNNRACERAGKFVLATTPMEKALLVLHAALQTVNQAGLDGKELNDLTIVERRDAGEHHLDTVIEVHAKVKHRLKATT